MYSHRAFTSLARTLQGSSSSRYLLGNSAVRCMSTTEPQILSNQRKNLLVVELNRPKALNSLTTEMCKEMRNLLEKRVNPADPASVSKETAVGAFIVKGRGGKAFCAGGDVKTIWQGMTDAPTTFEYDKFFRAEYYMNYLLGTSIAPQVSFWDGIVMGGGVGISIFGEFRVATEKTVFAMPETAIGLFPDVGGSSWLPHLQDGCGMYIGLSGCKLGPADLIHTNIATHFIASEKLAQVEEDIARDLPLDPAESRKYIKEILDRHQSISAAEKLKPDPKASHILRHQKAIQRIFGETVGSVEEIFSLLDAEASNVESPDKDWASQQLTALRKMSPASLKVTFGQLRKGSKLDLGECLKMEFRLMIRCLEAKDFREGIRALLIDKDGKPQWDPSSIEQINEAQVKRYFESLGDRELIIS